MDWDGRGCVNKDVLVEREKLGGDSVEIAELVKAPQDEGMVKLIEKVPVDNGSLFLGRNIKILFLGAPLVGVGGGGANFVHGDKQWRNQ